MALAHPNPQSAIRNSYGAMRLSLPCRVEATDIHLAIKTWQEQLLQFTLHQNRISEWQMLPELDEAEIRRK